MRRLVLGITIGFLAVCSSTPSEAGWPADLRSKQMAMCKVSAKLSLKQQGMLAVDQIIPDYCECMMAKVEEAIPEATSDLSDPQNIAGTPEYKRVQAKVAAVAEKWVVKCIETAADKIK